MVEPDGIEAGIAQCLEGRVAVADAAQEEVFVIDEQVILIQLDGADTPRRSPHRLGFQCQFRSVEMAVRFRPFYTLVAEPLDDPENERQAEGHEEKEASYEHALSCPAFCAG